jgi:hypothetical protein
MKNPVCNPEMTQQILQGFNQNQTSALTESNPPHIPTLFLRTQETYIDTRFQTLNVISIRSELKISGLWI